MKPPTVFISYSHQDEAWKDRLRPHLGVLEKVGRIVVWDDRRIDAGDTWYPEIEEAMADAAVAVLLISADFLFSDFITKEEVPYLLERRERDGMVLIPVLLRPCPWRAVPWVREIQMLPRDGKSVAIDFDGKWDEPFTAVAERILEILTDPDYQAPTPLPPKWPAPEDVDIARLPVTGAELFGRVKELELLDQAWDDDETHIAALVAWGGVGKSTLVNRWLERMAADNFRGARRVFAWSFYSQGTGERVTSADQFVAAALAWFGDDDPTAGSPWAKGERLAGLVRREKALLLLDGMEPLQSSLAGERGTIKDPALATLLTELARDNSGLCVITTRETVSDLAEFPATVRETDLEQISAAAGRALLRVRGVRGADAALEAASDAFGNHALAINLLAAWLRDITGHDITRAAEIPDLDIPVAQGRHPRRVMAAFADRFGDGPEVELLRLLGLFDRPAEAAAISAVRAAPAIPGLTAHLQGLGEADWMRLLQRLRTIGLLAPASEHGPDTLDAHPLVREHFGAELQEAVPDAWRTANGHLYEHYRDTTREFPDTIEEMAPLYAALAHGCGANRHQEAFDDVHLGRIYRGEELLSIRTLGAFGMELAALAMYFDQPWDKVVADLSEAAKSDVLNYSSFSLRSLGRLAEAVPPLRLGLRLDEMREDWGKATVSARNLSEVSILVGDIHRGIDYARQSVDLADQSGDKVGRMIARTVLADALCQIGNAIESEALFQMAENMQIDREGRNLLLYSTRGFYYCELLLDQGKFREVQDRATETIQIVKPKNWLLAIALDRLSLGRAHLAAARLGSADDIAKAEAILIRAVEGLREARSRVHIPRGLLARATLHRIKENFSAARRDLEEAVSIAARDQMRLHQTDARLELARLHLAAGEVDQARACLAEAKTAIEAMGYHRRDKDVAELTAALADG